MSKKYKVTCFDSRSYKVVHKFFVTYTWDYLNHRWVELRESLCGISERFYSGLPEDAVKSFLSGMNGVNTWQYWTVKPVSV